ncbi:hypothetical protein Cni_G12636 [Canna indica]|uniref:Uncharacterized protein n=1 Tax=Canna indica TaxID=4628 RepID=A0AAQ3QBY6_9LILI|nr:hypothetical protein Cni_G12636 [Canna indica]
MPLAGSESSALEAPSPSASHVVPLSSIFSRINGDLGDLPAPVVDPTPASVLGEADGTETTLGVDCYEESTMLADVSCTILNTMGDRASDDTSFPRPEGVDAQMWPVVSNSFPFGDGVLSSCGARERASAPCLPADDCLGALSRLCYELCSAGVDRACLIRAWWAWGLESKECNFISGFVLGWTQMGPEGEEKENTTSTDLDLTWFRSSCPPGRPLLPSAVGWFLLPELLPRKVMSILQAYSSHSDEMVTALTIVPAGI